MSDAMHRAMILGCSFTLGLAMAAAACLETPEVVLVDALRDAAIDVIPSAVAACTACLNAPFDGGEGCLPQIQACEANAVCKRTLECSLARSCFGSGTAQGTVQCGLPCALEAGLKVGTDDSAHLGTDILICSTTTCAAACIVDGGQ